MPLRLVMPWEGGKFQGDKPEDLTCKTMIYLWLTAICRGGAYEELSKGTTLPSGRYPAWQEYDNIVVRRLERRHPIILQP